MNESAAKVLVERDERVLKIALNRPEKYNGFDLEMYDLVASAYGQLERDPELRCGLLHANGKHFTAGLDLAKWTAVLSSGAWPSLREGQCDPLGLDPARSLTKPVVVAAQGLCYTIGIELMLAADIRVCAENTRFGQIEVRRGIYAVGGATVRMVQEFGWANAQRYLLTGDDFDAAQAQRLGLVQDVVPLGEELRHALDIAARIAKQAPLAVYASLKSSRISIERGARPALERLLPDLVPVISADDAAEGVRSFVERREANFKGS